MAKVLKNASIWNNNVYKIKSNPRKLVDSKEKYGLWCGHTISLEEKRFGKASKTSLNNLKKRIKRRSNGQVEFTPKELEKYNTDNFYNKHSKFQFFYSKDKKRTYRKLKKIISTNKIQTELIQADNTRSFIIRIKANYSILLALIHSINEEVLTNKTIYSSWDTIGTYNFWKNNCSKNENNLMYFDLLYEISYQGNSIESYIEVPYFESRVRKIYSYSYGSHKCYQFDAKLLTNESFSHKELLLEILGFDVSSLCNKLLANYFARLEKERKVEEEDRKKREALLKDEKLLDSLIDLVPLDFLDEKIKPKVLKRLGITLDFPRNRLKTMKYEDYLKTDHWKKVSSEAKVRAGYKCQLCSSKKFLQVHHNDYKRRGCELPTDLVVLCKFCHAKHHDEIPF